MQHAAQDGNHIGNPRQSSILNILVHEKYYFLSELYKRTEQSVRLPDCTQIHPFDVAILWPLSIGEARDNS